MKETNLFKWTDFYSAFATRLLDFKNDRLTLIQRVQSTFQRINVSLPTLDKDNNITDIDPFTVFGLFNKGIKTENRIAIINELMSEFSVKADVPDNFYGIPVLNPMKATFYRFEGDRQEHDIDNLWTVFESAVTFADGVNEKNRTKFCAAYDRVLPQYAIKWNLTMGLYWIRPYAFLNLDSRNRKFLSDPENVPADFAAEISSIKAVPSAVKYLEIRDKCTEIFSMGAYSFDSFPKLSYEAWKVSNQDPPPDDEESPVEHWEPSEDEYSPGFSVEEWLELLHDKDLIYEDDFIGEIWGGVLAMFYTEKDGASCKKIGQKFNLSSSKVIARCNQLAQHIYAKKKCPLWQKKYWPILFVGRNAKPGEVGTYLWKLRPELYEALTQFNILRYLPKISKPGTEEPVTIDDTLFSRNMILYGPPGTGKTYNAVNYAVAICESKKPEAVQAEDYEDVLYRFNTLKNEGRIAFTTFHQSYGYEEFIEGIQPVTDRDDSSKLEYIIRDGIFKSFCARAVEESIQPYNTHPDNETPKIWGMILGGNENPGIKKQCFENNEIRLGFSEYKDEDISDDIEPQAGITWQAKHMINDFRYMMKPGDYVVIEKDYRHIDAVGIVTGDYEFDDSQTYPRKRSVKWLVKGIDEEIIPYLPEGRSRLARFSLFDFDYLGMDSIALILQRNNAAARSKKPFVFIIDEINRGNISRIFGELITLIEGTKREGADEAMDVILPYSGKRFSVPDNVYILGTMNTADRSIALLDTALRRRFDFIEMMPDDDFLKDVAIEDSGEIIDIRKMFETMNKRIEILYDREHMIGHAYFRKLREEQTLENLREIFLNRIIPLLQEYFYDDYEKIQLVLGDNDKDVDQTAKFITAEEVRYRDFFRGKADSDDFDEKVIYRINKDAFSNPASYKKIYE